MSIHVTIQPGLTPQDVTASATGSEVHFITEDILRDAWGIDDPCAVAEQWFKDNGYTDVRVDAIHVNALDLHEPLVPAGHGAANVLVDRSYTPASVELVALGAKLVQIQTEVVLADHALWDNRGNPDPRHFAATMGVSSSSSVESSWSRSQKIGVSAEIGVSVGPVDAKTSLTYETEWGESHGESHGEEISFSNEIKGELEPGEFQVAALTQQRGFATIQSRIAFKPIHQLNYVGFTGSLGWHNSGFPANAHGVGEAFVLDLSTLIAAAGKPAQVENSLLDTCGVFADADLKSYPLPVETTEDEVPEAIDTAVGRHNLQTTYKAGLHVKLLPGAGKAERALFAQVGEHLAAA